MRLSIVLAEKTKDSLVERYTAYATSSCDRGSSFLRKCMNGYIITKEGILSTALVELTVCRIFIVYA